MTCAMFANITIGILSAEERLICMQSYRRSRNKAAAIYRAIAKSLA